MTRFLSIKLLILVLAQPFAKLSIIVAFQLDQERIAAELCEQRELRENTCAGHCQLEDMLAEIELEKQHEKHKQLPKDLKDKVENLFHTVPELTLEPTPIFQDKPLILSKYVSSFPQGVKNSLFRPPRQA